MVKPPNPTQLGISASAKRLTDAWKEKKGHVLFWLYAIRRVKMTIWTCPNPKCKYDKELPPDQKCPVCGKNAEEFKFNELSSEQFLVHLPYCIWVTSHCHDN